MEFSIATLLSNFSDDKLVAPKVLEKKLECEDDENLHKLQIVLDALEKIGVLAKDRGRYRREHEEDVVEAKLRCSSKGFCFAIQEMESAEDIYIRESHLSNAWNGDRVLVKVIKEGSRRRSPEGEVKLILERANPSVLARVKDVESGYRAVPLDDRLLFDIDLPADSTQLQEAIDYLVHVEVVRYPLGGSRPVGRVVQILGSDAEAANDIDIVCCKHDLPRKFSPKVVDASAAISDKPDASDLKNRQDFRSLFTLALVPESSEHPYAERALGVRKLEQEGLWQVVLHISDVAARIQPDTSIDREAQRRGTSIFLGKSLFPLLPESVRGACALTCGQEQLALSLLITLDEAGDLVEFEVHKSVVEVDCQLTYPQAQAILDCATSPEDNNGNSIDIPDVPEAVSPTLDRLWQLSQLLRERRLQRGAFELDLPESNNHFDSENPLGVLVLSPLPQTQAMMCEFVVLANQCVGEHLQALGIPAIFRTHPSPDIADVQDAIKLASNMGMEMWLEDEETVYSTDFKQFTEQILESEDRKILTYLLEATLKPTSCSTKPGLHFGLALETGYTHWTSPLQRYADVLVQRSLHALFERGRDRRSTRSKDRVDLHHSSARGNINWNVLPPDVQQELEERMNAAIVPLIDRERLAIEAEEDWQGLQKAGAMKGRTGEVFRGLITGVQSYGFFVELESSEQGQAPERLEGLVHVSSLKDDWYEYRSRQQTLVGRKNRKQYRLGDRVDVQVKSVDYYRQQIDLAPIGGGSEAPNGDYYEGEED
ncbi:MAG: ribonuclease R family protein [Geitlerinemataceae cyanobacterium]